MAESQTTCGSIQVGLLAWTVHIKPSNTWYPAGSAHHYWCQTSTSCFCSKRAAWPFDSVLALGLDERGLICTIKPTCFMLISPQVCETRRPDRRCVQLGGTIHMSGKVELKVAAAPSASNLNASRLTQPQVTKKTSPQAPVPVFADAGGKEEETHSFMNGEFVRCDSRQPNYRRRRSLHPATPHALTRSFYEFIW